MTDSIGGRNVETVYDLLLPDHIGSVLVMHREAQPPLRGLGNRNVQLASMGLRDDRPGGSMETGKAARRSVDCIVLHHALDDPPGPWARRAAYQRDLIRSCKELLAPGGVLAISCSNPWNVDRARSLPSGRSARRLTGPTARGLSLWECHRTLRRAGFKVVDTFAVVPDMASPAAVISVRRQAARVFYERAAGQGRGRARRWTRLLLGGLNALNLRAYLEPVLLVLATHD